MKKSQLQKIARDIIKNNIYLTLATADSKPWAASLYYQTDNKLNFYFVSPINSLHSKHIQKNSIVSFTIFDSHQPKNKGNGIQASGKACILKGKELQEGLKWFRTSILESKDPDFVRANYQLFKIIPNKFYIWDPDTKIDIRTEVKLKK